MTSVARGTVEHSDQSITQVMLKSSSTSMFESKLVVIGGELDVRYHLAHKGHKTLGDPIEYQRAIIPFVDDFAVIQIIVAFLNLFWPREDFEEHADI